MCHLPADTKGDDSARRCASCDSLETSAKNDPSRLHTEQFLESPSVLGQVDFFLSSKVNFSVCVVHICLIKAILS